MKPFLIFLILILTLFYSCEHSNDSLLREQKSLITQNFRLKKQDSILSNKLNRIDSMIVKINNVKKNESKKLDDWKLLQEKSQIRQMSNQVDDMTREVNSLIDRMDDYSRRNSNSYISSVNGQVTKREYNSCGLDMGFRLDCPNCDELLKYKMICFDGDSWECDKMEFTCRNCNNESYFKPCNHKHLNKYDEF